MTFFFAFIFFKSHFSYSQINVGIDKSFGVSKVEFIDKTSKLLYSENKIFLSEIKTNISGYWFKLLFTQSSYNYNAVKDNIENNYKLKSNSLLIGLNNKVQVNGKIFISVEADFGISWFKKESIFTRNNTVKSINQNVNFYTIFIPKFNFVIPHNLTISIGLDANYLSTLKKNNFIKNINSTGLIFGTTYTISKRKNENIYKNF